MKRIFNINSIVFMIIGLILGGFVVYAANERYSSDQVLYIKDNEEHVLTAIINDIYDKLNYGDAVASDIAQGKKALVKGKEVTGTATTEASTCSTIAKGPGILVAEDVIEGEINMQSICTQYADKLDCNNLTSNSFYAELKSISSRQQLFSAVDHTGDYSSAHKNALKNAKALALTYDASTNKLTYSSGVPCQDLLVLYRLGDGQVDFDGGYYNNYPDNGNYTGVYVVEKEIPKIDIYVLPNKGTYTNTKVGSAALTSTTISITSSMLPTGVNCKNLTSDMFYTKLKATGASIKHSGWSASINDERPHYEMALDYNSQNCKLTYYPSQYFSLQTAGNHSTYGDYNSFHNYNWNTKTSASGTVWFYEANYPTVDLYLYFKSE